MKVCVIGAGPAGIAAARHLSKNLDKFEINVFEKSSEVGGQWLYTDKTNLDENGYPVHSAIYKKLITNGPKELMNFPDWPEYKDVNTSTSSVAHCIVLKYLKNYTDHFNLRTYIQFNTIVEKVQLHKKSSREKWKVTVRYVKTSKINNLIFDKVIICNGHYSVPYIPKIPGLRNFEGKVIHSHKYRKPEDFRNKSVIILGGGTSGVDIGLDLKNHSSKVYLSHNKPLISVSLTQIKGIDRFEDGRFVLKDNSTIIADALIFCTGYNIEFPFLDKSCGITVEDNFISPLYKHLINVVHPSMGIIGIPRNTNNLVTIYKQAECIVSFWNGTIKLPPEDVMLKDSRLKTPSKRKAHVMRNPWDYTDDLTRMGFIEPLPEFYKFGMKIWYDFRYSHLDDYKYYNFIVDENKKSVQIIKAN